MKFSEVQHYLEDGLCIRRNSWNESPHRAFYVPQIKSILVVDINNKVMQDVLFECQVMANDWELLNV